MTSHGGTYVSSTPKLAARTLLLGTPEPRCGNRRVATLWQSGQQLFTTSARNVRDNQTHTYIYSRCSPAPHPPAPGSQWLHRKGHQQTANLGRGRCPGGEAGGQRSGGLENRPWGFSSVEQCKALARTACLYEGNINTVLLIYLFIFAIDC